MALVRWMPRQWGLRRWEPFRDLEAVTEDLDRWLDEFAERPLGSRRRPLLSRRTWMPAVDMVDQKDEVVVKAEIPGMDKKYIHVSVDGDVLNISGEKKAEREVKEEDYYSCEIAAGKFFRSIPLPVSVETSKIKAEYKDGILEIHLPKSQEVKEKTKEIPIG